MEQPSFTTYGKFHVLHCDSHVVGLASVANRMCMSCTYHPGMLFAACAPNLRKGRNNYAVAVTSASKVTVVKQEK